MPVVRPRTSATAMPANDSWSVLPKRWSTCPRTGLSGDEGYPEIAGERALEPVHVLHQHRSVKPELCAHALDVGARRADARDHLGGVAGNQMDEEERSERCAKGDGHQGDDASQDEPRHQCGAFRTSLPRLA